MSQIPAAIPGWLKTSAPVDIVMMLMGTNDVWRGRNVATSMANYEKSLDAMKAAKVKQLVVCAPNKSIAFLRQIFRSSPLRRSLLTHLPGLGRKDPPRTTQWR
jgi:hypothetical protein